MPLPAQPLADRFWSKVRRGGPDDCWNWQAGADNFGYGRLTVGSKKDKTKRVELAHRTSWFLLTGEWATLCVLHQCDNPRCVNPRHLFLGTRQDNMADKMAKGRQRNPRGEGVAISKLTAEKVLDLRRRHAAGETIAELAKAAHLSWNGVQAAVTGVTWGWVSTP